MSFCENVKAELNGILVSGCCRLAECYGLLYFSRTFSDDRIIFKTRSSAAADRFQKLMRIEFGAYTVKSQSGEKIITYKVSVNGTADRKKIHTAFKGESINMSLIKRDCCKAAFLRGVFLACGTISDPEKEYDLEFLVYSRNKAEQLKNFLSEFGFSPKIYARKSNIAVCHKNSSAIEEIMARIGCSQASLELMGTKIYRNMRVTVNRKTNCETANSKKTVDASVKQMMAIKYLESTGRFDILPDDLRTVAVLRRDNPDAPLSYLCKISSEPLTRSGMNHRLARLVSAAEAAIENDKLK